MVINRPSDSAPVNRRGGRGRGRGSTGPRASLKDEEGKLIPELSQYVGGRRPKGEEPEESAEPKRFPDIPPQRYPPKPYTMDYSSPTPPPPESNVGERNGEQKSLPKYPKPTKKQMFMREALSWQLAFYRQSDYCIEHEDLVRDGGAGFQAKKANKIIPGMYPAYYPEEITKQELVRKRRAQEAGVAVGTWQATGSAASMRKSAPPRQLETANRAYQEEAVFAKYARREAQSMPQGLGVEDDEDIDNQEPEDEDGAGGELSDEYVHEAYKNYDDDDDDQEPDEENTNLGTY